MLKTFPNQDCDEPELSKTLARYVEHPVIWNRSIELRSYQKNIADSAQRRNTMVILPTALGKTVISLLVCADMLYNYRDKRILVMAPTRPLVSQHMKYFSSVLKISEENIASVTGKILPYARRAVWDSTDIRLMFATPEVVKNDLEEGRLNLKDFGLLVFDEAHRAMKEYAYTSIAKEYIKQSSCPYILAMTASPGAERKRIQEVCNNLLIEHIEYRSEDDPDVKPYVNAIDVKWEWLDLPEEFRYIVSILRSMLEERIKWLIRNGLIMKGIKWVFKRDLIELGEALRYKLELTMEEQRGLLYIAILNQSSALTLMYCLELIESQGSYSLKAFLDRIDEDGSNAHTLLLKDPRMMEIKTLVEGIVKEHPKILHLLQLIKDHHRHELSSINNVRNSPNIKSKILVFTQYRDTAKHIVEVLEKNDVKTSRFVGQAKRIGDEGMKQDEQAAVLDSFRNSDFDVLVATSIAEEGLDIPEVDLVIFYEPISSEIRYIQRKGRAGRKSSGSVIILATKDTIDMRHLYASKMRVEKMTNSLNNINTILKPINRSLITPNPMTLAELSIIENNKKRLEERLLKRVEAEIHYDDGLSGIEDIKSRLDPLRQKSNRQVLLSVEADLLTNDFKRQVDRVARRIHVELAKAGKRGIDIKILCNDLGFEYTLLIEAIKKLEKLKRVEWLNEDTVVIADSLKKFSGKEYAITIGKIFRGLATVMVDGKWHARLNYYDYDGPRELLKRGTEFRAIGELYHDAEALCIRIKQIV
ncbi:MAG TPA: helicase-related protein [Nitrososphaeraceae archaeon]|nr:helicase-related protein [Nitrososphaeraceae archaeon]